MRNENLPDSSDMIRVSITMPRNLHEQLQLRAQLSGAGSVTELLRRGAVVYGQLIDRALESDVLEPETIAEIILRSTLERVELKPFFPFAESQ